MEVTLEKVKIDRIVYQKDSFSIAVLSDGTKIVGYIQGVKKGAMFNLTGVWEFKGEHGKQLKVNHAEPYIPVNKDEIIKYLASGIIKGIGRSVAKSIYETFGQDSIKIMDNDIHRLIEVKGIGKKSINKIIDEWEKTSGSRKVMIGLSKYGFTLRMMNKIYDTYHSTAVDVVTTNPYQLIYDIKGVGFQIADDIAMKVGISKENTNRIRSSLIYILKEGLGQGHIFLNVNELYFKAKNLLDIGDFDIKSIIRNLIEGDWIKVKNNDVYLELFFKMERLIEGFVLQIKMNKKKPLDFDNRKLSGYGKFSDEQLSIIEMSKTEKILLLTGGPGTGKTTTIKGIIELYSKLHKKILLAAPTGKAAKRMQELSKMDAQTIHLMLIKDTEGNFRQGNYLDADLLIIDETSMVDISLMYKLMCKINPESTTVVFVGDKDQLPSVGPGNVFLDLLGSGAIPTVKLTKVFRQQSGNVIIQNAIMINNGQFPVLQRSANDDFVFIDLDELKFNPADYIAALVKKVSDVFNYDPLKDIQILSFMYNGTVGVNALNRSMQNLLNPGQNGFIYKDKIFKAGDKVLNTENDYKKEVFNGDTGYVIRYDKQSVYVDFGKRDKNGIVPVEFQRNELDVLVHAYAITVHKSQGNEYPVVIMPVDTSQYVMLNRQIFYTGVTRASEKVFIVGREKAISMAVNNNKPVMRNTSLFKLKDEILSRKAFLSLHESFVSSGNRDLDNLS